MKRLLIGGSHNGERVEIPEDAPIWNLPAKTVSKFVTKAEALAPTVEAFAVERYAVFRLAAFNRHYILYVIYDGLGTPDEHVRKWIEQFL
jgi:hypothetical protein